MALNGGTEATKYRSNGTEKCHSVVRHYLSEFFMILPKSNGSLRKKERESRIDVSVGGDDDGCDGGSSGGTVRVEQYRSLLFFL
ncbi:hypothetical protein M0802_006498 [Mischocyttarus mexicanus]|nr:hypothetical protein M0802_006498 [Mischocyttarus mexicanus]